MSTQLPERVESETLTWRAANEADLPAVHALFLAAAADEPHARLPSLEDLKREFDDPWSPPASDTWLAQKPDGSLAAYGRIIANPAPEEQARAFLDGDVHPVYANGPVEEKLLDWLERRGNEVLRPIVAAHPGTELPILRIACWDKRAERIRGYERRGFQPIRNFFRMRRDLKDPIPDRPLPEGLAFRNYSLEIDERLRLADNEAFLDHWSHEPVSENDWQQFIIQGTAFRADLTWAVMDSDEVAAYSLNRYDPEETEREGYGAGWIGSLGTRRPWRKRGLASALLVKSMRSFKQAGLDYVVLGVDAQNPTGALGLYEGLGFKMIKRTTALEKRAGPF
ncbi:MAG: GNAT family N-acetyltransferase [Anaerolineales bacterium]